MLTEIHSISRIEVAHVRSLQQQDYELMPTVAAHYENHLGPIYLWMAGGMEHALALGRSDLSEFISTPGYAVDLGAGFGMHAIPLARAGFRVLAVDLSQHLLNELKFHSVDLPVTSIAANLLDFSAHMSEPADLILCMGDTLTHLASTQEVEALVVAVAASLRPEGRFVTTFRDYRTLPVGDNRFIPVRSDAERIHTCFLEERAEHVIVHDIVHERARDGWSMKVSHYEKLRLAPDTVIRAATAAGLSCRLEPGPRGMVKLLAWA